MLRVVFMGTPEYAAVILCALLQAPDVEVVGVCTQPDKVRSRRAAKTPSPVKSALPPDFAGALLQPTRLRDAEAIGALRALAPQLLIVAAYGRILPQEVLDIAPCYNLHASLLPRYRGASPIQQALLSGDSVTGVSLMRMNAQMDCGEWVAQSVVHIGEQDACALFETLSAAAAALLLDSLPRLPRLCPLAQLDADASRCQKIAKADGLVCFGDAAEIVRKIRAYSLFPHVFLESGLKLKSARVVETHGAHTSGEILEVAKDGVVVGCARGALLLQTVQPPSKNAMSAVAYLNGKRLQCGDCFF
ncbi:MAG: methionyl-tRNA formyltransferase [Helicobacter sp.]|nr:methionyl-tRNA formyltransferase [Helicobacter sp.]